ncbi:hypothetical protein MKX01_040015, partial [Papaver californicum]
DFVFGAGTSAYQVEGAAAEDGRSPCLWIPTLTREPNSNMQEDVKLMSELGLEAYRFSISWSRLIPGIQPHATLYHLDLPQILEDEYAGWLSPKIIEDFTAYADVCFREFGDRVSYWTTINEANIMSIASYDSGICPPQRCSYPGGVINCTSGNSSVEPYIAMHNVLLTHASVAAVYKERYHGKQKGMIGMNIYCFWCTACRNASSDIIAAQRANDFYIGWLNHYFTVYVKDDSSSWKTSPRDYNGDMGVKIAGTKDDTPARQFFPGSLPPNPSGLLSLLHYMKDSYGNPPVYVQENGTAFRVEELLQEYVYYFLECHYPEK